MSKFKYQIFGYSRNEVDNQIRILEENLMDYKKKIENSESKIEKLKSEIIHYKERENFLSEVMVDAKSVASKFLKDSRENADNLSKNIIDDANNKVKDLEKTINKISELEKCFSEYESILKSELKSIFENYLRKIDDMSLHKSEIKHSELEQTLENAKLEINEFKNNINGKNDNDFDNLDNNSSQEVPLYVINSEN